VYLACARAVPLQVQCTGSAPTVSVDKCDGVQVYIPAALADNPNFQVRRSFFTAFGILVMPYVDRLAGRPVHAGKLVGGKPGASFACLTVASGWGVFPRWKPIIYVHTCGVKVVKQAACWGVLSCLVTCCPAGSDHYIALKQCLAQSCCAVVCCCVS
jgi:hypothetical protein